MMNNITGNESLLLPYLTNYLANEDPTKWEIIPSKESWITVLHQDSILPMHGWKIHLSAIVLDAVNILNSALPILIKNQMSFKFPATLDFLYQLNSGKNQDCQAGKFITVYPKSNEEAVKIAWLLHDALKDYRGPKILSDYALAPKSLVHYRFGSFKANYKQTLFGAIVPVIKLNNHSTIIDQRLPFYTTPSHIENPFSHLESTEKFQKIINNRYLIVQLISRSLNGDVMLALDLIDKRRCILKLAARYSLVDLYERDIRSRLIAEKDFLDRLKDNEGIPKVYDYFYDENDNYILVLEDISGKTLEDILINHQCENTLPSENEVIALAIQLLTILNEVHQAGIVHADLKLTNIILMDNNKIKLIDFNTSYCLISSQPRFGSGTRGFSSPQLENNETPSESDDIYSIGAILYYYACNSLPAKTGLISQKMISINEITSINSHISNHLADFIVKCLSKNLNERFLSVSEMLTQLEKMNDQYLQNAVKLGNYLLTKFYSREMPGAGFSLAVGDLFHCYDLRGSSGSLLALAALAKTNEFNKHQFKQALHDTAYAICHRINNLNTIPGLYIGESGTALALLQAGLALNDEKIMKEAIALFEVNTEFPHESPDLFNGSAGRLRVALRFWQKTKKFSHFQVARNIVKILLKKVVFSDQGECWWLLPNLNSLPNLATFEKGETQFGYAHGASGIADALLDFYELEPSPQIEKVIRGVILWLQNYAFNLHDMERDIGWPVAPYGEITAPFWCHGAAGIGIFLLHAAKLNFVSLDLAERAAQSAAKIYWAPPIFCHGLVGNISFLMQIYQYTKKACYKDAINKLSNRMSTWIDNIEHFPYGIAELDAQSYITGIPSIINCYLQLAGETDQFL